MNIQLVLLVAWNLGVLALFGIVVVTAVFRIASSVQRWAFNQPNVLVVYFPWVLLPAMLVPGGFGPMWPHSISCSPDRVPRNSNWFILPPAGKANPEPVNYQQSPRGCWENGPERSTFWSIFANLSERG